MLIPFLIRQFGFELDIRVLLYQNLMAFQLVKEICSGRINRNLIGQFQSYILIIRFEKELW